MVAQEQQKPFVIGLDLGGTNSVFGIVDQRGNILTTNSIKTQAYKTAEDFVSAGVEALKPIIAKVGGIEQIKAMGIGAPNGNYYRGTIEFAPNVPWGHDGVIPLADMFSEKLGIPVGLTNDANAAAIGEMQYGVARGMKNFIMITLGTGVGSGIVVDGHMVYGSDGFAGELGHTIIRRENGRPCGCGRKGCLETYCSATGVARTARETNRLCCAKWTPRKSPPSMYPSLPARATPSPTASMSLQDRFSVRLAPISWPSPHPRLSSSLVD